MILITNQEKVANQLKTFDSMPIKDFLTLLINGADFPMASAWFGSVQTIGNNGETSFLGFAYDCQHMQKLIKRFTLDNKVYLC